MKKVSWPVFFGLLVVVGLVIQWRPWHQDTGTAQTANSDRLIESPALQASSSLAEASAALEPSSSAPLEKTSSRITAQLSPVTYTTLSSQLNGMVDAIPLREGQSFQKGALLVSFDCATEQARLDKSRAVLSIATRNSETQQKLLQLGAVAKVEAENAQSEFQKAQAEVAELNVIVSYCRVRAPFSGKIATQRVRAKQFVQTAQPLLEVVEDGPLELEFIAPSHWVAWLKAGDEFKIRIDETAGVYAAHVTRIGAVIDPVSQTVKVSGVIDGDRTELKPGMSGVVLIEPRTQSKQE